MSEFLGGKYTRNGLEYEDAWFVYAALAETGLPQFYATVGLSKTPLLRMAEIQMGCPFQIVAGTWSMLGSRSQAAKGEARVRRAFARRQSIGPWFGFDRTDPEDKRFFNSSLKTICETVAGRQLEWGRVTQRQIQACVNALTIEKNLRRG